MNNHEISFEITQLYANKKCKHCYGRGYLVFNKPKEDVVFHESGSYQNEHGEVMVNGEWKVLPKDFADYCYCVKRNLNKAMEKVNGS